MTSSSQASLPDLFAAGTLVIDGESVALPEMVTVRQMVAQRPERARVFERYGIVYCCCAGNKTFWEACSEHHVDPRQVLADLQRIDAREQAQPHRECGAVALTGPLELRRHISEVHYTFLSSELPRLSYLIARVAGRHGELYPELWELQSLFEEFKEEVESNLEREENYVFPLLERLVLTPTITEGAVLQARIAKEVCTLEMEHEYQYKTLSCLNSLASAVHEPETACNTSKVMLYALAQLSMDMHLCMEEERHLFQSLGFMI